MISLSVHLPMDTFWQSILAAASSRFLPFFRCVCVWDLPKWPQISWPDPRPDREWFWVWESCSLSYILISLLFLFYCCHTQKCQTNQNLISPVVLRPPVLFNLHSSTIGKINPSLVVPPVINPVVFISHGSFCIKHIPLDISSAIFCSSSQQFVSWCDRLPLSPPSVAFSSAHLHLHALAVRPLGSWDWSTIPWFITHQAEVWLPTGQCVRVWASKCACMCRVFPWLHTCTHIRNVVKTLNTHINLRRCPLTGVEHMCSGWSLHLLWYFSVAHASISLYYTLIWQINMQNRRMLDKMPIIKQRCCG